MPKNVHQNIGSFWNAAEIKLHVTKTCFHAGLKSQTCMSLFRLSCERTLSRWLCNSFSKETFSIKDSFPIGNKSRTTKTYGQGSEGNVEEGGNKTSQYSKGRVLKQFVPCKKEEWGAKASNKSETSKCVYTIQLLQNWRIAKSEIFVTRGRLSVQARSKGCILLRSFTENLEEIRSVPLIRKLIQISVPMFWLGSCPTNFHRAIKNPNCNFTSHIYKNDYLLGRHPSNGSLHRGDKHVSRHSNLQLQQISSLTFILPTYFTYK